ncbi:hypothetical protein EDB85DRAFT_2152065 [Lactarius pseudohatsudake]|nr:hypothetical protein EDB85DRAFT_2152065 [Lactarius pseudohatsudake]
MSPTVPRASVASAAASQTFPSMAPTASPLARRYDITEGTPPNASAEATVRHPIEPPSPPPHAVVDAEPIRAQQGREKRPSQRCSSVGSIADSDESPAHKSVPLSLAQRQVTLNVAAHPFTLPGLGGIDIGAIKKAALQATSPHPSRPSLDDLHLPAISHKAVHRIITNHGRWDVLTPLLEPPPPPRFPPRDERACSLFSDTSQYEERFAAEPLALHQDVLSRLMGLPDSMAASIKAAQLTHAELLAHTVTKADFEEVQSMMATNSDLRVQLADLRAKVDEIQAFLLLRATDAATSQARTMEALNACLSWEKLDRELNADKQALVSKVHALEAQQVVLLSQPSERFHGRDLRRANEQLEQLAALVSQVQMNEPELEDAQLAHEQAEGRAAQL